MDPAYQTRRLARLRPLAAKATLRWLRFSAVYVQGDKPGRVGDGARGALHGALGVAVFCIAGHISGRACRAGHTDTRAPHPLRWPGQRGGPPQGVRLPSEGQDTDVQSQYTERSLCLRLSLT